MSDQTKVCILGLAALVGITFVTASGNRPQAIAQPPAAACRCVDCLDDSDVRRIVAEELSKQSLKAPTSAPIAPASAASADPLIGKKNADGSVTVAVQYDTSAPLEAKRKLPPIRKPPMPFGGAVVDGVQGVVGGAVQAGQAVVGGVVQGTCRIVNGRKICN